MNRSKTLLGLTACILLFLVCGNANSELLPFGVLGDEQTSIVYVPETGEIRTDPTPGTEFHFVVISSQAGIFSGDIPWLGYDSPWAACSVDPHAVVVATGYAHLSEQSLGPIAQSERTNAFIENDLAVEGVLRGGRGGFTELGPVDLVYMHELFAGDANRDFTFDQLDLVNVQQAGKYLTGQPATWGEGDWNGAPGGYPGEPPAGNGFFDQRDIVAALQADTYLSGGYAATQPGGISLGAETALGETISEVRFIGIFNQQVGAAVVSTNGKQESVTLKDVVLEPRLGDRLTPGESIAFSASGFLDQKRLSASATAIMPRLTGSVFDLRGHVVEDATIDIPSASFQPRIQTMEVDLISAGDEWQVSVIRFQFLAVPEPTSLILAMIAVVVCFAAIDRSAARQRKV